MLINDDSLMVDGCLQRSVQIGAPTSVISVANDGQRGAAADIIGAHLMVAFSRPRK